MSVLMGHAGTSFKTHIQNGYRRNAVKATSSLSKKSLD